MADKFKHITAESITIACEDSPYQIDMLANKRCAGIWVQNTETKANVGIVVEGNQNPYIIIYGKGCKFPSLAIKANEKDGKIILQIVNPDEGIKDWSKHVKFIELNELEKLNIPK